MLFNYSRGLNCESLYVYRAIIHDLTDDRIRVSFLSVK